jgi:pyocin large subunit-like protein
MGRLKRLGVFALMTALLTLFAPAALRAGGRGFRSERLLDEDYTRHGREFGVVSRQEYLKMAQSLRDAKPNTAILECHRTGGRIARFDKRKGWFVVFDEDGALATFFIPNDGVRYFYRQANTYGSR